MSDNKMYEKYPMPYIPTKEEIEDTQTNQEYVIRTKNDWKTKSAQDLDKFLQEKIESNNMTYLYHTSKFGLDEDLNLAINQETDEFNEELKIVKKWLLTVPKETLFELEKGNLEWWDELGVGEMYRIEFFHQLHYKDNILDEITMQGEFHEEGDIVKDWIKEWKNEL